MNVGRLHLVTDTTVQTRYSHAELAELAIAGGVDTVQYRSKLTDVRVLIREAGAVREVCRQAGVPFIVNDRVDICLAVDADGVHLGRTDMPIDIARAILGRSRIVGGTVRSVTQLDDAVADGADYVGLGPVFGTTSKSVGHEPLGLQGVRTVTRAATIPVIAIAGITLMNARSVVEAGAFGIAVIGAIANAVAVTEAAQALARAIAPH